MAPEWCGGGGGRKRIGVDEVTLLIRTAVGQGLRHGLQTLAPGRLLQVGERNAAQTAHAQDRPCA